MPTTNSGYTIEPIVPIKGWQNCQFCWGELLYRDKPNGQFPQTVEEWRPWYQKLGLIISEALEQTSFNRLSINIDSDHILDPVIAESVWGLSGLPVLLEWTESRKEGVGMREIKLTSEILSELREKGGFPIVFDDVGAGEDSFGRLCYMQPDIVKVDGPLFRLAKDKQRVYDLVGMQIDMYRHLEIPVVAEWIETQEDLEVAQQLDMTWGQGHFWSHEMCDPMLEGVV